MSGGQLVFDLPLTPGMGREDFFETPANRQALAMVERWPTGDERSPLLIIHGPPGSGKTHLSEIWRARTGALKAAPEDILTANLPALLGGGHLVVEDMQAGGFDETALFHLINLAREQRAWVLLTAAAPAAQWPVTLPDLNSRLAAAMVAEITAPDDELLRAVLVKLFTDRQLRVKEEVIAYLLRRMERSLAAARALVALIDHAALQRKAEITRPFVARLLKEKGLT